MASMLTKLKQFKDLRSQAKTMQNVLSQETSHGSGAGGKVNVIMDGTQKIISLDIDPTLLVVDQKKKVEQGVVDAIAGASKELQKIMAKKLQSGEMTMPDLSSLK
ncbi:MAG: YbaB/EbfC family nucleoid-associated protein [Candidatus Kerfeldbacteria bacterium]|nr:YbaB/EbfC family nucleoid-associated protein [Candidatus Kerfeldbacteria bacterium]